MKKGVTLFLAMLLLLVLAACTPRDAVMQNQNDVSVTEVGNGRAFEGQTIKYWSPVGDVEYFKVLADAFYEKTGCTVESTVIPWGEMSTKYVTSFMVKGRMCFI